MIQSLPQYYTKSRLAFIVLTLTVTHTLFAVDLAHIAKSFQLPVYKIEIVSDLPHDTASFTQGLLFQGEFLYESTGLYGQSKIRKLDPKSGRVISGESLPAGFFGEGIAWVSDRLVQLTWQEHTAFIWHPETFSLENMWAFSEEGWGLTTDGKELIMSDGSATLYFRSPYDFTVRRTVGVNFGRGRLNNLNELEYVNGKIYCNVLGSDVILQIEPDTGEVSAVFDGSDLRGEQGGTLEEQPLNGIAYDSGSGLFYLTGKHWSKIYRCKISTNTGG